MENKAIDTRCLNVWVDQLIADSNAQNPAWNIERIRSGHANKWNYVDGCMIYAVLKLYEITKEEKYLRFADDFMEWFVQEDGSIRTYHEQEYNLDHINPGKALFMLYDLTGKERYRKGIETIYQQIKHHPRTAEGSFWHKKIYPNQV